MLITFRNANLNDLDEICKLVSKAIDTMIKQGIYQWDELYPTREDFEDDINNNQLHVGIVDNRIAVIYVLNQVCDEEYKDGNWKHPDRPYYVVHRLCVNPEFQSMGIAKCTLHSIEQELKSKGICAIRLDAFCENPISQRLYTNYGYETVGYANWRKGKFCLMEKYF